MTPASVAFVVYELGQSGGVGLALRYARHLLEHTEFAPELVLSGPKQNPPGAELHGLPVRSLAEARESDYQLAIATWWGTVEALYELRADRRVLFLQSIEQRFYLEDEFPDRLGAATSLALPTDVICTSSFLEEVVTTIRPESRCIRVPPGIDKSVFRARESRPAGGPLRILVEGQPTLWFKGVQDAVATVRLMREPAEVTLAAPDPGPLEALRVDRVVSAGDPPEMAALYAEHDVLLKLSRVEGLGLPPLEAFHVGVPCVVTPFTGSQDYVEHGSNGLVVGFDDLHAAAGALDLLAADPELRARLSKGALATAERWPDVAESDQRFAQALLELAGAEPPDGGLVHALRAQRLGIELSRHYTDALRGWQAPPERGLGLRGAGRLRRLLSRGRG